MFFEKRFRVLAIEIPIFYLFFEGTTEVWNGIFPGVYHVLGVVPVYGIER